MMNKVHTGRPIRRGPSRVEDAAVMAVLVLVGVASVYLYYRGAGDMIALASVILAF